MSLKSLTEVDRQALDRIKGDALIINTILDLCDQYEEDGGTIEDLIFHIRSTVLMGRALMTSQGSNNEKQ